MLLTRDNVLKFVRSQKYVTPTQVSKEFEVVTTIASAALSELVKDLSLKLTYIKFGTTPYYYDPLQKECLIEIAQKSFSGNELALFEKIKEQQILSKNSLTIPEQVIINKLQDISYQISVEHQGKEYVFIVWYLRDKKETLSQIKTALNGESSSSSNSNSKQSKIIKETKKSNEIKEKKEQSNSSLDQNPMQNSNKTTSRSSNPFENIYKKSSQDNSQNSIVNQDSNKNNNSNQVSNLNSSSESSQGVDSYLHSNGFKIIEKEKHILGNVYKTQIKLHSNILRIDCISVEQKKVQIKDLMEFYTSSMCPKYIFHTNLPKKIELVFEELDNCYLVKLKEL